jgi:hypothetical protein
MEQSISRHMEALIGAPPQASSGNAFNDFWTKKQIEGQYAALNGDQTYVMPMSIKHLIGTEAFEAGRKTGEWSFSIEESMFPNQRHVRVRGLSVYAVEGHGLWQATITPPKNSYCRHLSGRKVDLDQTTVPVCRAGRVYMRDSFRPADVTGSTALRNISPFGTWKVAFGNQSIEGTKTSKVADVQIDVFVAVQEM